MAREIISLVAKHFAQIARSPEEDIGDVLLRGYEVGGRGACGQLSVTTVVKSKRRCVRRLVGS